MVRRINYSDVQLQDVLPAIVQNITLIEAYSNSLTIAWDKPKGLIDCYAAQFKSISKSGGNIIFLRM